MITTHSQRKRVWGGFVLEAKTFPITRQLLGKLCGLAGRFTAHTCAERTQPRKKENSCAVFLLFRVCEKGSNALQPPESPFGLDQFILNEVFIRGIFIRPGLYYKGNIRLRENPANVFPIVCEPKHVFYCKIMLLFSILGPKHRRDSPRFSTAFTDFVGSKQRDSPRSTQ